MRTRTAPRPWTAEEETLLREHVANHGPVKWNIMASALEGRSHYECRNYWTRHLDPTLTKGPWTSDEDAKLIELCKKHGRSWKIISDMMPGRADIHCRSRFLYALDVTVRKDPWTDEEDAALSSLYEKHGKRWVTIADQMPGRTDAQCCGRMNTLLRRKRSGTKRDVHSTIEQNSLWTPEQDSALQQLQEKFGNAWTKIAELIPGQTKYSCQKRWYMSAEKPKWTLEEDVALLSLRQCHGNDWTKIAAAIPGRTELQCRARWTASDKQMRAYGWTPSEDATLVMLYARYGNSWTEIAEKMVRRTSVQCRMRCASRGVTPIPDIAGMGNEDRAVQHEVGIPSHAVKTSQDAPSESPDSKKSIGANDEAGCKTLREECIAESDETHARETKENETAAATEPTDVAKTHHEHRAIEEERNQFRDTHENKKAVETKHVACEEIVVETKLSHSPETCKGETKPTDAAYELKAFEEHKSDSFTRRRNMNSLIVAHPGDVKSATDEGNDVEDIDFSCENAIERVLENAQRLQDQLDVLQKRYDAGSLSPRQSDVGVEQRSNEAVHTGTNSQFVPRTSKRSRPDAHDEVVALSLVTTSGIECTVGDCGEDTFLKEGDLRTSANESVNETDLSSQRKRQRHIGSIAGDVSSSPNLAS